MSTFKTFVHDITKTLYIKIILISKVTLNGRHLARSGIENFIYISFFNYTPAIITGYCQPWMVHIFEINTIFRVLVPGF